MNLKRYYGSHPGQGGLASSVPNNSDSMIARIVPLSTVFPKSSASETPLPSPEPNCNKTFKLFNETLAITHEEDASPRQRKESNDSDDSIDEHEVEQRELEDQFPPIAEEGATEYHVDLVAGTLDRRKVLTSSQRTERLSRLIRQQRSSENCLLTFQPRPINGSVPESGRRED
uniref:Uncharacterized protein n=1 Tax=Cacopsylla melanoneura TaxID=428564 RepID=A0A8D8LET6_9HEMI